MENATEKEINMFDLDLASNYGSAYLSPNWKEAAGTSMLEFDALLETAVMKYRDEIYPVDPLLFVALMRKESDFDSLAISRSGAAGLTQIMPMTAKGMGMKNIFMPEYFNEVKSLIKREREARKQATAVLFQINEMNKLQYAKQARALMQTSLDLMYKRKRLIDRYRKELLERGTDDRLQPDKAIEYGLMYFAKLLKDTRGDISLALASYNAGPNRVREFEGIPPYIETVGFRNRILQYYRDYLSKARDE
jgi:soluble lytic murein transglycosylase-like protein